MIIKLKKSNLIFRKLKLSDFNQFKKLFKHCFGRDISFKFFKLRYFDDKFSFCYGVFQSSKLIANVGMFSIKLNNKFNERIFSRHSSMVLKKYRGQGIFSDLLALVKKEISKKVRLVVVWPNKNNFANFGIEKKSIIKKKYYLYKVSHQTTKIKKTNNFSINGIIKFRKFINNNESFFLKNFSYFKKKYLTHQKHEYFLNKFEFKKYKSFFILKFYKDNSDVNYIIMDHFGSENIRSKHLNYLIAEQNKLIFLSQKKINRVNLKILNYLNFKILFIKKFDQKQKKNFFLKKEIYLGDTDIFATIEDTKK